MNQRNRLIGSPAKSGLGAFKKTITMPSANHYDVFTKTSQWFYKDIEMVC
jgi:hypothetical protein